MNSGTVHHINFLKKFMGGFVLEIYKLKMYFFPSYIKLLTAKQNDENSMGEHLYRTKKK